MSRRQPPSSRSAIAARMNWITRGVATQFALTGAWWAHPPAARTPPPTPARGNPYTIDRMAGDGWCAGRGARRAAPHDGRARDAGRGRLS